MSFLGTREPLGRASRTFNFAVGAAGLLLLLAATLPWARAPESRASLALHLTFLALFVLARLLRFELSLNITASLVVPMQLAAIVLLGPVATAWLALPAFFAEVLKERALSGLTGVRRRAMLGIIAFNIGMEALVTLAAGAAWQAFAPHDALHSVPADLLALGATFVVFKLVNEALMCAGHWLRGVSVREYAEGARSTLLIETLTLPLAALLVLIHQGTDRITFYLFLVGTLLAAAAVRGLTIARRDLSVANADLSRRVREIETLSEIGRAISADIEFESLLATIYRRCADILVANHFFIALYNEGSDRLRIALEMIRGESHEPKDIPLGEGLTSHVILSRQPLLVHDLLAERERLPAAPLLVDDRPNRSWLGVPMIARGEVVGAIVLQEREPNAYDENDVRVLSAIAAQAAISVKNARLHQEALHALRVEAENRELRRLNDKKSDFVNMVAHQFRTPLTTVIGYANLLVERVNRAESGPVADMPRFLGMVHAESRRLSDMVEELLNLSRIRSGRFPLTRQRFDLGQLVRETLASHQLLAERRRHVLRFEPAPEGPLDVPGDSNLIRQVVGNMVANALQYAPDGTAIVARTRRVGREAVVEVEDEGPGVPPGDLERIFDEFYRAPGRTADVPGTGLGLSICRGIVEAHGGRTWAERRGPGTAFCFTLPLDPAENEVSAAARGAE